MAEAKRDGNMVTTLIAVSNVDGITPVVLYADPTTHRLLVSATAGSLDDLSDVTITSVAQGDILYYNGTAWVNLAAGTNGHFLKTQGAGANPTWAAVSGTGDVVGPSSATDNAVVRFDSTTGKLVQNSAVTIADTSGNMAGVGTLNTHTIPGGTDTFVLLGATQTLTAKTLTSPVINSATVGTSLVPTSDDGAALGDATHNFSDLFLATGAVINYANGNVVITHTSGILTMGTGELRVTTPGTNAASVVTVGGTQTLTNKTLTSPTLTTPSAFTTGGTITLAENTSIALDPAGSADGKYSGITIAGTAGATLAFGNLVYLASADSRWELTDADAATTADRMLGMVVLAAASDGDPTVLLLMGTIRADAAFPALTIGSAVYVGETAGAIQVAIPTGADNVIRRVGYALTADEIYFNPSMDSQISVA